MKAKQYNDVSAARYLQEIRAIKPGVDLSLALSDRRRLIVTPTLLMQRMWMEASRQGRVVVEPSSQAVLANLRLHYETSLSWTSTCIGKVLGTMDADALEDYLRPRRDVSPRHCKPRPRRITRREDRSVLVMPYFDVPGRIRAVAIIRADNSGVWDIQHHDVRYGEAGGIVEGGMAMHPKAIEYAIDNKVLVTADAELYLRLVMKNFSKSPTPLPIVCSRQGDIQTANWQMLHGRQAVIWSPSRSPQAIWQAIQLDAHVSCEGPQMVTRAEYVRQREPNTTVKQKLKYAQPWQVVVSQIAQEKSEDDLADWLAAANLSQREQQLVLSECPGKSRDKLKRAMGDSVLIKSFPAENGFIEQRSSGWYFSRGGGEQLITDTPFRICEAFADNEDGKITYHIDANYLGTPFSFHTDAKYFRSDPFGIVQEQAVQAGVGMPTYDPKWRNKAMHWALQFHSPVMVTAVSRVGMDRDRKVYSLPGIRISTGSGTYRSLAMGNNSLPGRTIDARTPLQDAVAILEAPSSKPILAAFTGVACQILCDIAGVPQPSLLLSGDSLLLATDTLRKTLGCHTTDDVNVLAPLQHRWPVVATEKFGGKVGKVKRAIATADCPLIMPVSPLQQAYALFATDHIAITAGNTPFNSKLDYSPIGRLLLEIVSIACRDSFHINFAESESKLERTRFWIRKVLKHHQLPWRMWQTSAQWCAQREDTAKQLIDLTASLIVAGRAQVDTLGRSKSMAEGSVYYNLKTDKAYIQLRGLRTALREANCPAFDFETIFAAVSQSSTQAAIQIINGKVCWVIDKQIMETAIASRRQIVVPLLRVVG